MWMIKSNDVDVNQQQFFRQTLNKSEVQSIFDILDFDMIFLSASLSICDSEMVEDVLCCNRFKISICIEIDKVCLDAD